MSESTAKCPQCGAILREHAPAGLCPNCLMALNLKTETSFTGDTPGAQPPLPPEHIAPHFPQLEILECLGRGGMGVVYKARQKSLNRFVALKLLAPERVGDAKFAERFTREAQALAALNHPNIVTIYDFGQAGGFYFLLMEFVDGANLRQLLRSRKFSPEEALAIVPPLCDALQFAHDKGIVHRDIKPENLLVDKAGRVKVADFGIAKMLGTENVGGDGAKASTPPNDATQSTVGTPAYSAPEQKSDPKNVDSRADIYSLGVVFYEMLTGELPGKRIEAPSKKVHIDVRLDEVVLRALEKTPELRYQQVSEVKTFVENLAANPAGSQSGTKHAVLTAVNIVIAAALLAGGWAVYEAGIFFNALYFFVLLMVPISAGLLLARAVQRSLALGIWRRPFAPEFRRQRWQIVNFWVFWVLAFWTLGLCLVPAQFTVSQFSTMHGLFLGGIFVLMLLELLPGKKVYPATNLAFAIGSIFMLSQITKIYWPVSVQNGVTLEAPVRGEWLVINGGNSSLVNGHYGYKNQSDALDLELLVNGHESRGDVNKLESYPSWGQTVYAPADGKVALVVNDLRDNTVGQTDEENVAGNQITLDLGSGRFVTMAHLQKGSVLVSTNEEVHAGQPIAKCGNSGNTSHPHLHIQVENRADPFGDESDIRTWPILFRDVKRIRSGESLRNLSGGLYVRRNDRLICESPTAVKSDYIGGTYFTNGDQITITSVERDQYHLRVKGHYHLASRDSANLTLNITSASDPVTRQQPNQSREITRGEGEFELLRMHPAPGFPHVSMYANGYAFAGIYFGTKEEADEERRLDPGKTQAPADLVAARANLASLRANYGEQHPQVQAALARVKELERLTKEEPDTPADLREARAHLAELRVNFGSNHPQVQAALARVKELERLTKDEPDSPADLREARAHLAELRVNFGSNHPEVLAAEAKVRALESAYLSHSQNNPVKAAKPPAVVETFPAAGATNVDTKVDLRIRFDQSMNSNIADIISLSGSFLPTGQNRYDAERNEFIIPAQLMPGQSYDLLAQSSSNGLGGFRTTNLAYAGDFHLKFTTKPAKVKYGAPKPVPTFLTVDSDDPKAGQPVARGTDVITISNTSLPILTLLLITFDQPMQSTDEGLPWLQKTGVPLELPAIIPAAWYQPELHRFLIPILMPPDNDTKLKLFGFRSADGVEADPVVIRCQVGTNHFSAAQLKEMGKLAQNPQLESILKLMKAARTNFKTGIETVENITYSGSEGGFNSISAYSATFQWQGSNQVSADISEIMNVKAFRLGNDGTHCWLYADAQNGVRVVSTPVAETANIHVSVADPFGLLKNSIPEVINHKHLIYLGEAELNGHRCHLIQSWSVNGSPDKFKIVTGSESRWWINEETFLPVQLIVNNEMARETFRFSYRNLNESFSDTAFQPLAPDATNSTQDSFKLFKNEPPAPGERRFFTIKDGADGEMSGRIGSSGPDGTTSSGLN